MEQSLTLRIDTSTYTIQDVLDEIKECVELVAVLGYPELLCNHYTVDFSTRRVRNFGTCQKIGNMEYKIVLNKHYVELASSDNVHNTIMHEVLHSITGCMNHGVKWKAAAARVNEKYTFTTIQRLGYDNNYYQTYAKEHRRTNSGTYKYRIVCDDCDRSWNYKSKCRIVQIAPQGNCTCPYCKGHSFTVIKL